MKRFISLIVAATLGLSLISMATPANADAPAPVHTVTPAAQDTGKNISVDATVPVPVTGKSENVITHTWPANRLTYVEATAPDGWAVEYKTAAGWSNTRPEDLSTLIGIRTTGTIDSRGVVDGKQKLETTATSAPVPEIAGSYVPSGRGDGWGAFTSPKYLLQVYHHDMDYRLECHLKSNGELCGALYQVNGLGTGNLSDGVVVGSKAFSFVTDRANGKAAVVCTNVSTLPFTSCGLTDIANSSATIATQDLSSQSFDGQRIWAVDFSAQKLLCFDTLTEAACTQAVSSSLTGTIGKANGNSPGYTTFIAGKIFITADKTWCVVAATGADCAGAWPVNTGGIESDTAVIPHVTGGVKDGVCTLTNAHACFDFTGASITTPSGLNALLTGTSTKLAGGEGYWQTTAWNGNKVVWQSNPNGEMWDAGTATCYDWSIDAACAGFDTTVNVGGSRYSVSLDAQNSNCVLFDGDSGDIYAINLATGQTGCKEPGNKAAFTANDLTPAVSCAENGNVRTFGSISLQAPAGLTVGALRLTVQDGNSTDVPNFVNLTPDVNGSIDLSSLIIAAATNNYRFLVSAEGMTAEQSNQVVATLLYSADLPELCVTLNVQLDCPSVWGSSNSFPQPDIAIATEVSRKLTGSAAVVANQTSKLSVNGDATWDQCSNVPSMRVIIVKPGDGESLSSGTGDALPSPSNSPESASIGKIGPGEGVEITSSYGHDSDSPDAAYIGTAQLGGGTYSSHSVPFTYSDIMAAATELIGDGVCKNFTFTYRLYPEETNTQEMPFTDTSYVASATVTVLGDPSRCITALPTTTKLPDRPEDGDLKGLVLKSETKIKTANIDAPSQNVLDSAENQVNLDAHVKAAYKVHANDADRGLVTIPTNTVIQADTTLFKAGDIVNAYLQSPTGAYFALGKNVKLAGPLVLHPMRFLKPGRYEIIVTQVAYSPKFKRSYVKAPVFGKKTTRIVVYVIPPKAIVHFAFCKYDLSTKAKADLKELAVRLRGAGVITVTGYTQTDLTSPASRAANKVLSVNRAKTVAAFLRKQGLHIRMVIVGRGATDPVDVEKQYKNRRVTITYGF